MGPLVDAAGPIAIELDQVVRRHAVRPAVGGHTIFEPQKREATGTQAFGSGHAPKRNAFYVPVAHWIERQRWPRASFKSTRDGSCFSRARADVATHRPPIDELRAFCT